MTKKSKGKTKRERVKSKILKAKGLEKAGEIGPRWGHPLNPFRIIAEGRSTNFSGYPEKSKYEKSLEKHKKEFPELTKNIEADAWAASQSKKGLSTYGHWPKKVKRSPQKRSKKAEGGKVSDRHPLSEKEKRAQRQREYIKKHGERPPRRKTLAVTDKYKKIREQRKFSEAGFKPLRAEKDEGGRLYKKLKKKGVISDKVKVGDLKKLLTKKAEGGQVNTSRENRLEELGRVDAERGRTRVGKRNLDDEKKRIIRELRGR